MVCIKGKSLVLTGIYTTALLSLQAKAEIPESCQEDDVFWDEEDMICRTCTKCSPGMQTTVANCGYGYGSQGECEPCANGYYQDRQHTKERCKPCVHCDPDNGVEKEPCTDVQNRVCGCKPGYGENPHLANTCLKCSIWTGRPTPKGCEIPPRIPLTTQRTSTQPIRQTNATDDIHIRISISPTYINDAVKNDQGLPQAAVISIAISCLIGTLFIVIVVLAFYLIFRRKGPPPVIMNAGNNSPYSSPGGMSVEIPVVITSESEDSKYSKPENDGVQLAPKQDLQSLETWTPTPTPGHTPIGTPRSTPRSSCPAFNRSLSAPVGDISPYSDQSFSPKTDRVDEEEELSTPLLTLPEKTRKDANKCQQQFRLQKIREDKQKARSIGASFTLHDFLQDYNAANELSQMLEINEQSIKNDWRKLAAAWKYSLDDITFIKDTARRGNNMGLMLLLEQEDTEHFGEKNLENLLDSLGDIRREDAVQNLVQYLLRRSSETNI